MNEYRHYFLIHVRNGEGVRCDGDMSCLWCGLTTPFDFYVGADGGEQLAEAMWVEHLIKWVSLRAMNVVATTVWVTSPSP